MDAWERLHPLRLLGALAAVLLPFLTGCCTNALIKQRPYEEFRGIRGAYLTRDELGIVYTTVGNRRHDSMAWFSLSSLSNPELLSLNPQRVEKARGSPPEGANELPVGRGTPSLPPGATIAVFAPSEGKSVEDKSVEERDAIAIILVVNEKGQVCRLQLPFPKYRPWWHYPALPVSVALDVVTLPVTLPITAVLIVCLLIIND